MEKSIKDQLSDLKLNFAQYGKIPDESLLEDIEVEISKIGKDASDVYAIKKQLKKIKILRKNLFALDKYVQANTKSSFEQWMHHNRIKVSDIIYNKLGKYNNKTGGITAYFFNLQKIYDEEERKYDEAEKLIDVPNEIKKDIDKNRKEREEKRKNRNKVQQISLRDLKKDNKGFFIVELEEPEIYPAGDKENPTPPVKNITPESSPELKDKINKTRKKIAIWLAGSLIIATIIGFAVSSTKK